MSGENDHYRISTVVDLSIPHGHPFLLNEEQYQILHAGDPGDLKAWLFLFIGLLVGAVEALFSTAQTVNWDSTWSRHSQLPFIHLGIQLFIAAAAFAGVVICTILLCRRKSHCSDLKKRIEKHFAAIPVVLPPVVTQAESKGGGPAR